MCNVQCDKCGGKGFIHAAKRCKTASVSDSPGLAGSATWMRSLKAELTEYIASFELDDDQELCLESEKLILGWIDLFFENKIFDEGIE